MKLGIKQSGLRATRWSGGRPYSRCGHPPHPPTRCAGQGSEDLAFRPALPPCTGPLWGPEFPHLEEMNNSPCAPTPTRRSSRESQTAGTTNTVRTTVFVQGQQLPQLFRLCCQLPRPRRALFSPGCLLGAP